MLLVYPIPPSFHAGGFSCCSTVTSHCGQYFLWPRPRADPEDYAALWHQLAVLRMVTVPDCHQTVIQSVSATYTTCWRREEAGMTPEGRHTKHFFLQETDSGKEVLAVVGRDSARSDRKCVCLILLKLAIELYANCRSVQSTCSSSFALQKSSAGLQSALNRGRLMWPLRSRQDQRCFHAGTNIERSLNLAQSASATAHRSPIGFIQKSTAQRMPTRSVLSVVDNWLRTRSDKSTGLLLSLLS